MPHNRSADQSLADVVLDAAKAALPPRSARASGAHGRRQRPRPCVRTCRTVQDLRQAGTPGRNATRRTQRRRQIAPVGDAEGRRALADHTSPSPPSSDRLEVRRDDFRIVRFRQRIGTTTVFAVDASGSSAMHRLGEAKGAVELLLADCYVRRDQVALLAFRGPGRDTPASADRIAATSEAEPGWTARWWSHAPRRRHRGGRDPGQHDPASGTNTRDHLADRRTSQCRTGRHQRSSTRRGRGNRDWAICPSLWRSDAAGRHINAA